MSLSLTDRFWPKVNVTATCWLWEAATSTPGYGVLRDNSRGRKLLLAHRLSWAWANMCPMPPSRLKVDHICHVRHCVNPEHLRLVTQKQNVENRSGLQVNNKSGYQGVAWHGAAAKWEAYIQNEGKKLHLGLYVDRHEAGRVAKNKRLELHTHNTSDRL